MPSVHATYRLQLSCAFDLDAAAGLADYLDELGISHLYASPFLAARSGSPHGYDIIDHNRINPELGGAEAFDRLHAALSEHGMGCILDFVPNHMGIGRADNPWWLDVLEWGQLSPYAEHFDIDWHPAKRELQGKVLLPFLGASYGEELETGALRLGVDFEQGNFSVHYHDHRFPIGPRHYGAILSAASPLLEEEADRTVLEDLCAGFRGLWRGGVPKARRQAVRERAAKLKGELARAAVARPALAQAVEAAVERINGVPGRSRSFVALHRLLEAQAYRLSFWRVAADEINYRRFFDINELASLRVEQAELFENMHRLVFQLIEEGKLDGLRIDHIDGLFDPRQYCERLAARLNSAGDGQAYFIVEKILAADEQLPESWPVDGTTGYDFVNQGLGLLIDPAGRYAMDALYRRFAGMKAGFDDVLHASRKHVLQHLLASELQVLANALDRIAEQTWRTRDFTLNTLREALTEVIACFPVYRTYIAAHPADAHERAHIGRAVRLARQGRAAPQQVFDFVGGVLTGDFIQGSRRRALRRRVIDFAMRAQQLTSPVAAKGEEDTAFYRYTRFVALNEVGGDPGRFGVSLTEFHRANELRGARWPRSMLATATHDTKRGEDVRARLAVLSEIPDKWRCAVLNWARVNRNARTELDSGPAPSRNDEYLLYQTLVGSWPLELMGDRAANSVVLSDYRTRIHSYMNKAVREAKLRSSWAEPDHEYEAALGQFVDRLLDPDHSQAFLADFMRFEKEIAFPGMVNGLAQTLLKHAVPGIPDTYQGCELWDFSLVDPDNRRPVDFEQRAEALRVLKSRFSEPSKLADVGAVRALFDEWQDGRIKLYLIWRMLELRRTRSDLLEGTYRPLEPEGSNAAHLCAFARETNTDGSMAIFVAPRLVAGLVRNADGHVTGDEAWEGTIIRIPSVYVGRNARNVLTGASIRVKGKPSNAWLPMADTLADLPVAALLLE